MANGWQDAAQNSFGGGSGNWYDPMMGGATLGSMFGGLFGGGKNPYQAGQGYLSQIPGMLGPMFNPYISRGQADLGRVNRQYGALTQDPGGFINRMGSGFQASPGYQYNVDQAMKAANQAAAAGGMLGSPAEQEGIANTVHGLANQDYQQYLGNVLGAYNTGLSGQQHLADQGLTAGQEYGSDLSNVAMSQAMLAELAQQYQNQQKQQQDSGLGGIFGSALGGLGHLFHWF